MKTQANKERIFLHIIIMILLAIVFLTLYSDYRIKYEKEYYKTAMLSFCEISTTQNKLLERTIDERLLQYLPEMKECDYFVLNRDKK